jgi:phage gp46-like protein
MGYKITLNNGSPEMSFDQDTTIATDLLLSAMVQQGSFFFDPTIGLRELPKKNTDQNVALVEDYFKRSCKWLVDIGRAKSIAVLVERDDVQKDRINVKETAVQANDKSAAFETFVGVI